MGQTLSDTYPVNVASQATQASQAAIDLLWSNDATAKSKGTTAVELTFKHMLSKVIINIVQPSTISPNTTGLVNADLTGMTVTIKGMNTSANFNLATGGLGTYSTIADINTFTAIAGKKYEAIVLPGSFAIGALKMEFALNKNPNEVFTRKNIELEDFEPGKVYTYNITLKRSGVEFTCAITDWDATPTDRTGDAE